MIEQDDELQRQRLEAERQKLSDGQREQHDRFCGVLKENKALTNDSALKAAQIIRTEEGVRQKHALQQLATHADQQAVTGQRRAKAEAERQAEYLARKAERLSKLDKKFEEINQKPTGNEATRTNGHGGGRGGR